MSRHGGSTSSHRYRWGGTQLVWFAVGLLVIAIVIGLGYGMVGEQAVPPSTMFQYDHEGDSLTVTHRAGDAFDGSAVRFVTADGRVLGAWGDERVTTGDSTTVEVGSADAVRVVWVSPSGERHVVSRWRG